MPRRCGRHKEEYSIYSLFLIFAECFSLALFLQNATDGTWPVVQFWMCSLRLLTHTPKSLKFMQDGRKTETFQTEVLKSPSPKCQLICETNMYTCIYFSTMTFKDKRIYYCITRHTFPQKANYFKEFFLWKIQVSKSSKVDCFIKDHNIWPLIRFEICTKFSINILSLL